MTAKACFSQHIKSVGTEIARLCGESSHEMPVLMSCHVRIVTVS